MVRLAWDGDDSGVLHRRSQAGARAFRPDPVSDEAVEAARRAAWASADAAEGRQAFLDKRTPRFTGNRPRVREPPGADG